MTRGRIDKRQRLAEQLRKKRSQAVSGLALGARKPAAAVPIASRPPRPPVARAEPLPSAHYPAKRARLGKPQVPGDR